MRPRLLVLFLIGGVAAGVVAQDTQDAPDAPDADQVFEATDRGLVFDPVAADPSNWSVLVGGRPVDPADAGVFLRPVEYDDSGASGTYLELSIPFPYVKSSHSVTLLYGGETPPDIRIRDVRAQVVSLSYDHGLAVLFARSDVLGAGGGGTITGTLLDSLFLGYLTFVGRRTMVAYAVGTPGYPHDPEPSRFLGLTITSPTTAAPNNKDMRILLGEIVMGIVLEEVFE